MASFFYLFQIGSVLINRVRPLLKQKHTQKPNQIERDANCHRKSPEKIKAIEEKQKTKQNELAPLDDK